MIIEGTVTKVHEAFFSFEVNKVTICTVLHAITNQDRKLPIPGTIVRIIAENFDRKHDVIVLKPEDALEGFFTSNLPNQSVNYLNEVERLNLQPHQLRLLHDIYTKLLKNAQSNFTDEPEALVLDVFTQLLKTSPGDSSLTFLNQLRFVSASQSYYEHFDYWTFGNHYINGKYLLGYFSIHEKYGTVYFTDATRKIACSFPCNKNAIEPYLGYFVVLKDFIILTEIYNGSKFDALEYIFLKLDSVIVLERKATQVRDQQFLLLNDQRNVSFNYKRWFYFKITTKSLPSINSKGFIECWLEIFSENLGMCYLCLNASHAQIFPLLKEGHTYKFYHNQPLAKAFNKDFKKVHPSYPHFEADSHGIFIHEGDLTDGEESLMTVKEASENTTDSLIAFRGKIGRKTFVSPMNRNKVCSVKNFGTPGEQTHVLKFYADGKQLTVYLNDWENKGLPYGLLPDMIVTVRNVIRYNNYYKSTALTRIDVKCYEPAVHFNSVNLKFGLSDWSSEPNFLGSCDPTIPYDVVVWGSVTSVFIVSVKLSYSTTFSALITFLATDQMGEMKIFARDLVALEFLKVLMEAQDGVFHKWLDGLKALKSFEFTISTENSSLIKNRRRGSQDEELFYSSLTTYFEIINETSLCHVDLMCRKSSVESGAPIYTLLDSRK